MPAATEDWVDSQEVSEALEKCLGPVTLGKVLRASRTRLELTQKEMAERLGLKIPNLSALEHDKRFVSVKKARNFAGPLGLPESYLVTVVLRDQLRRSGFSQVSVQREAGSNAFLIRVA